MNKPKFATKIREMSYSEKITFAAALFQVHRLIVGNNTAPMHRAFDAISAQDANKLTDGSVQL